MKFTRGRRLRLDLLALDAVFLSGQGDEKKAARRHIDTWRLWRWLAWGIPLAATIATIWIWKACQ